MEFIPIGSVIIPDGYFGDTKKVNLKYNNGYVYIFYNNDKSFFKSQLPETANIEEAIYLLQHPHQSINKWSSIKIKVVK